MKYFILRPDPGFSDGPMIKKMPVERNLVCKEEFHKILKRQVVPMETNENTVFPDLLAVPFFLISEMMLSVVKMYGDSIIKRDLIFIDSQSQIIKRYFVVLFESVAYETVEGKKGEGRTIWLKREGRPLKERNIFEIKIDGKREIVINLDFAESILRRGSFGIQLEAVNVYETKETEGRNNERTENSDKAI